MKLSSYRRIFKTDYDENYQPLVEKLAVSINAGFDVLYDALNGKLSFSDNIAATIATFSVSVNSEGVPQKTTQFKLSGTQTSVEGLLVLGVTGEFLPSGGIFIDYTKNENFVKINNIKGLQTDKNYSIKVVALS